MLSKEANERLCRVGPGTPMGALMRSYWQPIAPYAALLDNPVRKVRILGEDLVLYRDRSGTLGLIQDKCAHRSTGMQLGPPPAGMAPAEPSSRDARELSPPNSCSRLLVHEAELSARGGPIGPRAASGQWRGSSPRSSRGAGPQVGRRRGRIVP